MIWPFAHKAGTNYWLKVFALYALTEACIQLLFFIVLNNFGTRPISLVEIHLLMWIFQCLLIWPIWWVAWSVRKTKIIVRVFVNLAFYIIYSYIWFGPVQDLIGHLYDNLIQVTRTEGKRIPAILDNGDEYSYLNYQLLKHAFRLSWFYLAAYFYNYRLEEKKRLQLAIANRELQLKMLKWHLNPSFYFKTINHLQQVAGKKPDGATVPILQLAKVMEYVIYEAKEKLIGIKKEIQFLNNYTRLINQQENGLSFETEVSGEHDNLRISPLLLAGFVDRVAADSAGNIKTTCRIHLHFSGTEMQATINRNEKENTKPLLILDEDLRRRLTELYGDRYSVSNEINEFKLRLELDEER
ncbi:MAG TPA: histidine kinase [Chitinophagaceae bacterium]|jgi:hypothetical protein|nr:histidine kinase [Chitinophagaceae bacterium]